jgi:hypothetical protein
MRQNAYLSIGDVAYVDVSRPQYPDAIAQVDACDLPNILDGHPRWYVLECKGKLYAARGRGKAGARHTELMHRLLIGADVASVDHRSGDGLDNRRSNIRQASARQNQFNRGKQRGTWTSAYKGVSWNPRPGGSWMARIRLSGRTRYLGRFRTEIEAAAAYDVVAAAHHGEFASLNFKREPKQA